MVTAPNTFRLEGVAVQGYCYRHFQRDETAIFLEQGGRQRIAFYDTTHSAMTPLHGHWDFDQIWELSVNGDRFRSTEPNGTRSIILWFRYYWPSPLLVVTHMVQLDGNTFLGVGRPVVMLQPLPQEMWLRMTSPASLLPPPPRSTSTIVNTNAELVD